MKRLAFSKNQCADCALPKRQKGSMILESLIGLLILGIIGGGILHTTARVATAQQELAVNNIAMNQLRSMLVSRASASGDLCTGNHSLTLPGQTTATRIAVNGCTSANMSITGVQIGGTALGAQTVTAVQPLVLEMGQGNTLVRIGGEGNARVTN